MQYEYSYVLVCRNRWKQNGIAGGGARADTADEQYVEHQLLRVQSLLQMRAALASWWTLAFRNGKRERRVHYSFTVHSCSVEHVRVRYEVPERVQCVHSSAFAFEFEEQPSNRTRCASGLSNSNSND